MNPRIRDLLIGLTALIGVLGLAAMLFLFGEFQGRKTYELHIVLDTAQGLTPVSPVTLNGVRVGQIKSIGVAPDPRDGVTMRVGIFENMRIPRDIELAIDRTFVGDATLAMRTPLAIGGRPAGEIEFLEPGDTIHGTAATLLDQIGSLLDQRLSSLDRAVDSFERLSDAYVRVGERVEDLLAPRTLADVDAGASPPNIYTAVARVDTVASELRRWLGDETLRADAQRAVAQAANLFEEASTALETWTETAQRVGAQVDQIGEQTAVAVADFGEFARSVGVAVEEVRMVVGALNDGQGTAGQLLKNPDLFNAMTDAARRLERALLEAQLLVEKYRKEGIPIQW
ncbi:MAG: MCE family protein [Phycisphaerales bacterium]|nr:MAG: MCE family protein [Phycisphaerales bacterium]